jgi:hypothetical protein
MALVKVEVSRKTPKPFTREKSDNETKNELFLGKSGINFREQAIKTLGFTAGDNIGFTPDIDMKKGETIATTTQKLDALYIQKEDVLTNAEGKEIKNGYKLGTNNAITGTAIQPYLVELAGITSRFATKLVGAKPTDQLSIEEVDEILTGKQLVFTVATEPIEFEGKQLFEVKFKEITESKRGKKGEDSDSEITEVPMETAPEVEEEL